VKRPGEACFDGKRQNHGDDWRPKLFRKQQCCSGNGTHQRTHQWKPAHRTPEPNSNRIFRKLREPRNGNAGEELNCQ
jgi:hypothetical protein